MGLCVGVCMLRVHHFDAGIDDGALFGMMVLAVEQKRPVRCLQAALLTVRKVRRNGLKLSWH